MRDLTPKAEEFLVQYYMEPAKTWLALAIEQVLPELRRAILSSFLKELDESVIIELEQRHLHPHWDTEIPQTNLASRGGDNLYLMTIEGPKTEICLFYEGRELAIESTRETGISRLRMFSKNVCPTILLRVVIIGTGGSVRKQGTKALIR